jgi:hypothetical protein
LSETRWVRVVALASAAAVVAFGAVGLVLADAGAYHPLLVYPIGLVLWLVLLAAVGPVIRAPGASGRAAHWAGAGALALSVGVGCWNAWYSGEHVLTDRDPAIYNNAARWIARTGNLRFTPRVGPFAAPPFTVTAPGVLPVNGQQSLAFQLPHFLPALLAEARGLGGDRLMFAFPAVLGAVALLAFFVVASRVLRSPWGALAATATLAFVVPEVYFARDSYSEIPMQVLLFTALWLLCDESVLRRRGSAFVAGLCLGLLQAIRLDALSIVVGVPVIFCAIWIRRDRGDRRSLSLALISATAGIGLGLALGFADLRFRSDPYLAAQKTNVIDLFAFTVVAGVAAVAVALFAPALGRVLRRVLGQSGRGILANVAAVVALLVGAGAWLVRSHLNPLPHITAPSSALAAAGVLVPTRPYTAHSITWMAWYLGPLTVALAIVAAALLLRSLILQVRWEWLVAAALLAPETFLYLWRPHAHPDQVWVTRRLLVCAFPGAILLAFGLIVALARRAEGLRGRRGRMCAEAGVIALGLVAVVYPMATVVGVGAMSEQRDFLPAVEDACTIMGPDAALVIVSEKRSLESVTAPVPIRTWCGIPSAQYRGPVDLPALEQAAAQWKAQGRQLWIGAADAGTIRTWLPGARPQVTRRAVNTHQLSRPLANRPQGYLRESFQLAVAPVPRG